MNDTQTPFIYFKKYLENSPSSIALSSIRNMVDVSPDQDGLLMSILRKNSSQPKYVYETSSVHSEYNDYHRLREFCSTNYDFLRFMAEKAIDHKYYSHIHSPEAIAKYDSDQLKKFTPARYMKSIKHLMKYSISFHKSKKTESLKQNNFVFPGVRYLANNIVVFEMPPCHKHVDYVEAYREDSNEDSNDRHFHIPIPWQVYIAVFDSSNMRLTRVQMYFADTPLTDFNQHVYLSPLLNFYSNGELCRPMFAQMEDYEKYPQDVSGVIASAYDWIWNSGFNFDITETISEYIVSGKWRTMLENSTASESDKDLMVRYMEAVKYSSNKLEPSIVRNFFKLWQSVSLDNILACKWISFCKTNNFFNYEFRSFHENNYKLVSEWTKQSLGLELTDDWEGDDPPFEEWDENEHITFSALLDSSAYYKWAMSQLHNQHTSILDAYKQADSFSVKNLRQDLTMFDHFVNFVTDHQNYLTHLVFN